MAELRQEKFGVNSQFKAVSPTPGIDEREEQIKSAIDLTTGIGKSVARAEGREAALKFQGADKPLADVLDNVDLFEANVASRVQESGAEGELTERQLRIIRDEELANAQLTARGLQEAVSRGSISSLEANARANISLQAKSNSLIGGLFQEDYRNAFAGVTKNPSGSPALKINKSPAEIQAEANAAEIVKANAAHVKTIQETANKFNITFEQAETYNDAKAIQEEKSERNKALDESNARTDEEKIRNLPVDFSVATSGVMQDIAVSYLHKLNAKGEMEIGGAGVDVNEVATAKHSIRTAKNQIMDYYLKGGMGSKTYKDLTAFADRWEKDQLDFINAISEQTLSKEQSELIQSSMKLVMAGEMPLVFAVSQFNPQLAQSLGLMSEEARKSLVKRLGIDIERITNLTDVFSSVRNVVDVKAKTTPQDGKNFTAVVSGNSGQVTADMVDKYVEDGGNVSDLNKQWVQAPAMSLSTVAEHLQDQINRGHENSIKTSLNILNVSADKFKRLVADYDLGDTGYTVNFSERKIHNLKGKRVASVSFPDGLPEGEQDILRQMYRALEATPSLWEDDFDSAKDVFQAMTNGDFRFDVEQRGNTMLGKQTEKDTPRGTKPIERGEAVKPLVRVEDEEALRELIALEEKGEITPEQEDELADKLDRVAESNRALRERLAEKRKKSSEAEANKQVSDTISRVQDFENSSKTGFSGNTWKPHKSLEGGTDTLAYGHKLSKSEAKSNSVKVGSETIDLDEGITEEQAQKLFEQDWTKAGKGARKIISENKLEGLPQKARLVVQEMVFQMGEVGVRRFKKALKALKDGDYGKAADEMLDSKWAKNDSPRRAKILAEDIRSIK